MTSPEPRLQPLVVPPDWTLRWHELRAIDPHSLPPGHPDWELLGEDLLQIEHPGTGLLLDVGWRPEASPAGRYSMVVIRGMDWNAPVARFHTRSLRELVERIEETLTNPPLVEPLPRVEPSRVEDLVAVLAHDPDVHASVRAASLLAERHGAAAVPLLIAHLDDPRPFVRYAVADALRRLGDPQAGPALLAQLRLPEPDLDTRRLLIRALGAVRHGPAIPLLTMSLQDLDSQQRAAAASALAALHATEALPAVKAAHAAERDGPVRDEMRVALSRLEREQTSPQ